MVLEAGRSIFESIHLHVAFALCVEALSWGKMVQAASRAPLSDRL